MERNEIKDLVERLKHIAAQSISHRKYGQALEAISCAASILYTTNLYYADDDLEKMLEGVSSAVIHNVSECDQDVVLFYDAFGFDTRGLAQIYIRALCHTRRILYVSYSKRRTAIPIIRDIIESSGGMCVFLKERTFTSRIEQLDSIVKQYSPKHFFFYAYPDDVVATSIMYAYKGRMMRYQINLTDHAFWLGTGCVDKCIEFRDYGASISFYNRSISRDRLVKIPFYPIINYNKEFDGYPFPIQEGQRIVFSGGTLYKTFGDGNKYYIILDRILSEYSNVIIWYAGSGDTSEINKIIEKYPGRCYITPERADLFQVMNHCDVYLSTYPIGGGLMTQYAAVAGKVPLTLRSGNDSDGILLQQDSCRIIYDNLDELFVELDRLLTDDDYARARGEQLRSSVITPILFETEIERLLTGETSQYPIIYNRIDTDDFQQLYLERFDEKQLDVIFAQRLYLKLLKYEPSKFCKGVIEAVRRKFVYSMGQIRRK